VENTTIVAIEEQKRFGKFETPKNIAEFIAKWAIRKGDDLILEPCVGSGILLSEAIQQLKRFHASNEAFKNVYGVDIDSVAVRRVVEKLELDQSMSSNIICMDFLRTIPNKEIPLVDVILCNPPYTRHHYLEKDYKREIAKEIEEKSGLELSRQSSIYVHFLIHASRFLKEKGRMAFILPSNFLDVNYGVALKNFLIDNFRIAAIILFSKAETLFLNVLTTTCIVLLEKKKNKNGGVRFFKLSLSSLSPQNLLSVTKNPRLLVNKSWGTMNEIRQTSLDPVKKWNCYFEPQIEAAKGLIPLGTIAKVKRGIATGANSFFTLSNDEIQNFGIERRFLKSVLVRARNAPFLDFNSEDFQKLQDKGKKVWLVSSDLSKDALYDTNLLRYIKRGETKGLHRRYLTSSRQPWYSSEKRNSSPIIFTYMSRKQPRFISNEAKILVLNTFHFVYPEEKVIKTRMQLKAFLACLNSNQTFSLLKQVGRIYSGGLLKVEPRELERLPVTDFASLVKSDIEALANLFEQLCLVIRMGSCDREIRKEIDRIACR